MGQLVVVHHRHPFAGLPLDNDVGGDIGVGGSGEARGWPWVQGADEVGGAGDLLERHTEFAHEDGIALVGQVFEVLVENSVDTPICTGPNPADNSAPI